MTYHSLHAFTVLVLFCFSLSSHPYLEARCSFTYDLISLHPLSPPPVSLSRFLWTTGFPVSLSRPLAVSLSLSPCPGVMRDGWARSAPLPRSLFEKQYSRVRKGRLGTSNGGSLRARWAVWVFLDDYFTFCGSRRLRRTNREKG